MTDMPSAHPVIEIETTGPAAARRLLQLVRYGAQNTDRAVAARDAAIREAHRAGASLREIAEAAGVSHMTVKRIVERRPAD
jgi:DNA-binding NarL/FixJ family response regulator